MFRNNILEIYNQIMGGEGSLTLSTNNKEIKFSKHVDIISDYININLNDRKILTKLYNMLKMKSLEDYDSYYKISESITEYIQELIFDEEFGLVQIKSIDPIDILKGVSVEFDNSNANIPESFLEYISISERFLDTKLFIFISISDFFTDEEILQIYDTLLFNKTKFLILQNRISETVDGRETLYIIDEDLCEI